METFIFLFLVVLSPWPIFYSFLLYYSEKHAKFKFFITSKRQLYSYLLYLALYIIFFSLLFFSRLLRQDRIIDVKVVYETMLHLIFTTPLSTLMLLGLFGIIWIIFFIFLVRWLTRFLKNLLLSLYMYYYQYYVFTKFARKFVSFWIDFCRFLSSAVYNYTKNERLARIIYNIWPRSLLMLENFVHKYILLYLWIYDYMVNYGHLSKIFQVLPWYYIYTLLKTFFTNLFRIDLETGYWELSYHYYGRPRPVKIKEFAWIRVLLKIYEKLKIFKNS